MAVRRTAKNETSAPKPRQQGRKAASKIALQATEKFATLHLIFHLSGDGTILHCAGALNKLYLLPSDFFGVAAARGVATKFCGLI